MYEGCIEFNSFNDRVVSLYNFQNKNRVNVETPCKRYVLVWLGMKYVSVTYSIEV